MSIEVVVKTQWQGKVAIRQQYIEQAQREYKDLVIIHDKGSMRIQHQQINKMIVARTEDSYKDKFRKHKRAGLVYFDWKPNIKQGMLI